MLIMREIKDMTMLEILLTCHNVPVPLRLNKNKKPEFIGIEQQLETLLSYRDKKTLDEAIKNIEREVDYIKQLQTDFISALEKDGVTFNK